MGLRSLSGIYAFALIALIALTPFGINQAAFAVSPKIPLPSGVYPYDVVEQDLSVVLREFGQNVGIKIDVSPKIKGAVKGHLPKLDAQGFLQRLCEAYGLDWYYDGSVLYITPSSEQVSRFLSLEKHSLAELKEAMTKLSLYDDRYPFRDSPDGKTAIVSGPPRYVALAEKTLASLSSPNTVVQANEPTVVTVYRGGQNAVVKFGADDRPQQ
jgi:type III secretion protein C